MSERVVITSMGVISPLGFNSRQIYDSICDENITYTKFQFDNDVTVSPVKGFDLREFTGRFKYARYLNRGAELGFAAAINAVEGSGLTKEALEYAGLFSGSLGFHSEFLLSAKTDFVCELGYRFGIKTDNWVYSDDEEDGDPYWLEKAPELNNTGFVLSLGIKYHLF